ncbi:hypothetical protein GGH12_004686 [Coemansia sp. RSA 1822]|nr:hypothetical protein LPJ76_004561 [Coemansia sp. RSA 638]KAJ2119731.1 hypothetical protein IW147_005653 [Coemansia sp. RSA 720]KAJ2540359.1 hypothetical protein GGF49_004502 [Coemansia sp. RSA 1853]KAJ2560583.1 hypothetical protein GGH12_004686 [Coemansia sp. RSA 1822]
MSDRRTDASPRSTWITMDRDTHDSPSGDSESDHETSMSSTLPPRMREQLRLRGSAAAFLQAYNRNDLVRMRRHYQIPGLEELDDSSHEDDDESQQVMFFPESFTSEDLSDEEMHARMNILHEDEEEEDEDESSHEDSDDDDDEVENTNDEDEDEHSQYSAGNAMASFENLPSLNGTQPLHRGLSGLSGQAESKAKDPRQSFIPKYLESTAYGTLYHRRMLDQHKHDSGSATDGSSSTIMGAESECDSAVPRVAPDMFFKTLVQDSWPHYCTPVPTMPSFASLGFGLGVSESIYPVLPSTSSDSTQSRRGNSSDESRASWRARLVAQNSATNGSVLSRQQSSRVAQAQRRQAANVPSKDEKETEQAQHLPSAWTTVRGMPNLEITPNRETVKYTGPGRHDTDASMILTDVCIPSRTGVYYYEVYIKSRGQNGYIGIGLARGGLVSTRLPGWDPGSWGYHGDDGHVFGGAGSGTRYGPRYSTGDTVGCGIDFMKRRIFFTRNGAFLGHVFDAIDISKDLYPCVGMRTPGEHLVANFGRKPFVFDISAYVATAREDAMKVVKAAELGGLLPTHKLMETKDSNCTIDMGGILALRGGLASGVHQAKISEGDATLSIVLMHLLHNEYYATARALIENAIGQHGLDSSSPRLASVLKTLSQQDEQRVSRRRICKHISEGDIDHALGLLQEVYPQVLEDESLVFQLRCRQFIELVRAANGHHIASNVPDDSSLATPLSPRTSDMMDVDDSQSTTMLSLSAITNAPTLVRTKYGQLGSLSKMDPAHLVRVLLEYGRQLQADYGSSPNAIIREGLVHTFSLLAYADPEQSPISALLDPSACKPLARLVEMAIMATEKAPRMSSLECICRQTSALLGELSTRRNGVAALISVERDVLQGSSTGLNESL